MKITEAIIEYQHYLVVNQMKAKPTIDRYQTVLKQYQAFLSEKNILLIEEVTTVTLQEYLVTLNQKYQNKTISQSISIIRNFHNYISQNFSHVENPALKLKTITTSSKLPKFFSENELKLFFETFQDNETDTFHKAIFELLYATGLRISELVKLTFHELNTSNQMLKIIGKGNKERIIPIAKFSLDILEDYLVIRKKWNKKQLPQVFIKENGTVISRQYVWNVMKKQLILANLSDELSSHSFRHTFATDLLNNEADLRIVQELLGHSSVTTTQIYTHITNKRVSDLYNKYHPKSHKFKDDINKK